MSRKAVIAINRMLADSPVDCDVGHRGCGQYGSRPWRRRCGSTRCWPSEACSRRARARPRQCWPARSGCEQLPYRPDLVVCDVSFIGLAKVLPAVLACGAERFDALAMVKPQFEVGRERVGKGGVVRDAAARREALVAVARSARALGAAVLGFASSGLPGPKG